MIDNNNIYIFKNYSFYYSTLFDDIIFFDDGFDEYIAVVAY